jgi:hypothetical protein
MKHVFAAVAMFVATGLAPAQSVKLPAEVRGAVGAWIIVAPESLDGGVPEWEWDSRLQLVPLDLLLPPEFIKQLKGKVFTATTPGRYTVMAWNAKGDRASKLSRCVVIVGDPGPVPPVPPPPGPGPTPPVPPGPTPSPAPIPEAGFRVLVVYETADLSKLPPGQLAGLHSKELRDWLDQTCVKGPDGKTAEWRIWDQNIDLTKAEPIWQAAMKRPRASLPWVVVSNGKAGFEGPLPKSGKEIMELLAKYAE